MYSIDMYSDNADAKAIIEYVCNALEENHFSTVEYEEHVKFGDFDNLVRESEHRLRMCNYVRYGRC
jgi:hypothetical protein